MHALNSRYAKLYCRRYLHTGHLFQGRFRAVVAEKSSCLVSLIRYVHGQPAPLASSLPLYMDRPEAGSWVDLAEAETGNWKMEAEFREMEELRRSLQRPAIGSPAFLEEVKRRAAAAGAVPPKAAGPKAEGEKFGEEMELVPVRIREGWHRSGFLAAALMAGLVGLLSQRVIAPSQSKVPVIMGSKPPAIQPAGAAVGAARLARMTSSTNLAGTTWEIQMAPMYAGSGTAAVQDRIMFEGNQLSSSRLSAQGFPRSNVTLTPQEDGRLVWETMQTGPEGEIVLWRGECVGQRMRGVMIRQKGGKEAESFNFISTNPTSET